MATVTGARPTGMPLRVDRGQVLVYVLELVLAVLVLYPLAFLVAGGFAPPAGQTGAAFTLDGYARALGDVVEASGAGGVAVGDFELGRAGGPGGRADDRGRGTEGRGTGGEDGAGGALAASSLLGGPASGAVQASGVEVLGHEVPFRG